MTDFGGRHKTSHQAGGGDEISVAGLSGLLADEQDAGKIKGVTVDDTDKAADKVLAYNASTEKLKYETPAAGGDTYVDRGDPAAVDWATGDLTKDGSWRDLDCSAIVPASTKAIYIKVRINSVSVGLPVMIRENGNANNFNVLVQTTQVANKSIYFGGLVTCDVNRIIEYYIFTGSWNIVDITILGWLI